MQSFRDLSQLDEDDQEPTQDAVEIAENIAELERNLAPFESETWAHLQGLLLVERAMQQGFLGDTAQRTNDQLREIRGRVQTLTWAIGLPEEIRGRIRQQQLLLSQQVQDEEGESDDG